MGSLKKQKQDLFWEKKWRNLIHQKAVKEEMNKQLKASLERQKREEEEKECTFKPQTLWNQSFRKTVSFVDEFFVKLQPYIEQQQRYLNQLKELDQEDKMFAEKVKEELRSMLSKAVDREIMETIIEGYKGVRTRGMNKVKTEKLDILSKMIKLEREYNCFMARENVDKKDLEECGFDCDMAAKLRNTILKESLCPNSLRDFAKIRQEINLVLEEELKISESQTQANGENKEDIKDRTSEEETEEETGVGEMEKGNEEEMYYYGEETCLENDEAVKGKCQAAEKSKEHNSMWNSNLFFEEREIGKTKGLSGIVKCKNVDGSGLGLEKRENYKNYEKSVTQAGDFINLVPNTTAHNAYTNMNTNTLYKRENTPAAIANNFSVKQPRRDSFHLETHHFSNSPTSGHLKEYSPMYPKDPFPYIKKDAYSRVYRTDEKPYFAKGGEQKFKQSQLQLQNPFLLSNEFQKESPNKHIANDRAVAGKVNIPMAIPSVGGFAGNLNDHQNNNSSSFNNKSIYLNNNYMKILNKEEASKCTSNWQKEANYMNLVILSDDEKNKTQDMSRLLGNSNNPYSNVVQWNEMNKKQNEHIRNSEVQFLGTPSAALYPTNINKNAIHNKNWNSLQKNGTNQGVYAGMNAEHARQDIPKTAYRNNLLTEEMVGNKSTKYVNKGIYDQQIVKNKNFGSNYSTVSNGIKTPVFSEHNAVYSKNKNIGIIKFGLEKYKEKESFPLFNKVI